MTLFIETFIEKYILNQIRATMRNTANLFICCVVSIDSATKFDCKISNKI